jgi:hypothetical protein
MRKARKAGAGLLATLLMATVAVAVPAGSATAASDAGGSRSAVDAKRKKCKKGYVRKSVRHKQTCVRKRRAAPTRPRPTAPPAAPAPAAPAAPAWADGRWAGHYAENSVDLRFNVVGARLYTGGFDDFFISAACSDGSFDSSAIGPVQAAVAANGDFAGSGVFSPGYGQQIPWQLSGHIAGKSITGGTFTVGPYADFYGHSCGGTTHFTGQWIAAYTF